MQQLTKKSGTIILCAGGTGGHLFPATALAKELQTRGWSTVLISDDRAASLLSEDDENLPLHIVKSATPTKHGILSKLVALSALFKGLLHSRRLLKELSPDVVIGFGGYPTVPPMLAAKSLKIKCIIHDQNAVMGRANKFLAKSISAIATSHSDVVGIPENQKSSVTKTGNPLRERILIAAEKGYPLFSDNTPIKIVIFGGSQGARVFSDVMPNVLVQLPKYIKDKLSVVQQARPEDIDRVSQLYTDNKINADIQTFFKNLPEEISKSHLVISRSGAMTVAEISAIGRPSILVPLPQSLDGDQAANAQELKKVGAAWVVPQSDFNEEYVTSLLIRVLTDRDILINAAAAAKSTAILDATNRLADLIEQTVKS